MPFAARIFTPHNLFRIRQMVEAGSSAIEIAESIGSTPGSVRVVCSHYKIKLVRRGRTNRSPPDRSIVAHMSAPLANEFHRKPEQLQIPASVLAGRLLAAIVVSDIYEAVLDYRAESLPTLALAA